MNKQYVEEEYDIVVIGAGHAGCEAALAAARLGCRTILFTVSMDSVAMMPCNPNIGGSSKGHLVREIDALGGEMGKNIDKTYIQSKMLNVSKGPAVHSLRAQADKVEYTKQMRLTLQNQKNLTLRQAEVAELLYESKISTDQTDEKIICGVRTYSGAIYHANAVILCTGTYLKARCIYGEVVNHTGPNGLSAANYLSDSMRNLGIYLRRFKTGTPARLDKKTIDFSKMKEQKGDEHIVPFSFTNREKDIRRDQISCWLTYTNEQTHAIIRENIDRSPLFSGFIEGTGPRYCPSIEDKVMKFPDKDRHQLFIEPEGEFTNEMYMGGMSSSLPEDVQYAMIRTVPGLEHVSIVRNAYAIEYDCIDATNLKANLEYKGIDGLFCAGQINGSSGYEEAAAQGIMAGINAARKLKGQEPVILDRSQAYIGVLIDDLVTKKTQEPYRMMTSRAEYRLLLRQDNADLRLTEIGHDIGLIDDTRYAAFCEKRRQIDEEITRMNKIVVGANQKVQEFLLRMESTPLVTGVTLDKFPQQLKSTVDNMLITVNHLLATSDNGRIIKEGIRTVIVGRPNAGKSSVLNMLLGEDRAIVTEVAGTTRDTLEELVNIDGITLNIVDTAGIHDTEDIVEKIGVNKAISTIADADLILYIVDGTCPLNEDDNKIMTSLQGKKIITLINKNDQILVVDKLGITSKIDTKIIEISAKNGTGKKELHDMLREMFFNRELSYNNEIYITNLRHKNLLSETRNSLNRVLESINLKMGEDFFTIDLMSAYTSLGKIIGEELEDDLVNKIFAEFCMGK